MSRSAAIVIGYVMEKMSLKSTEAIKVVQRKRFCIYPNEGFRRQLLEYEPILRAKMGVDETGKLSVNLTQLTLDSKSGDTARPKRSLLDEDSMDGVKDVK